jgi:hypothetical protein
MTVDDVKPGMFLSIPVLPAEHIVLFIVNDELETETFTTVDVTRMAPSFLSYQVITKEVEEFSGDIDTAKKKVIESIFRQVGK